MMPSDSRAIVRRTLAILLLILVPSSAAAQSSRVNADGVETDGTAARTGGVDGKVVQHTLGDPLYRVNVTLNGTRLGTATRADGSFTFSDVPAGEYVVQASMIGYETATQDVVVEAGAVTTVSLALVERPIEIAEIVVERIMMTGGLSGLAAIPGSAHYISPQELEKFSYNDVNRVLRQVPGVNVQEEDGYGLRPNIGMRGTGVERSSKITVMEDGVLIAPAPYSAPAAYYFPTIGRMQGVEVRKGSSQIKYGPQTTGGALNLISTQIPSEFTGRADVFFGGRDTRTAHAYVGDSFKHAGYLLETYQNRSDGFKLLDGGGDTGFDVKDFVARVRLNTSENARMYQAVTFKFGRTTETSNETYLGLTDADFRTSPFRRYAASQLDVMDTEQRQMYVRHLIRPRHDVDVVTTVYRTDFSRNWYKLDKVRSGAGSGAIGIADLLQSPEAHSPAYAIVAGATSPNDDALELKANNREYYARGVQTVAGLRLERPGIRQEFELSIRYHEDQMDRFQWVDVYRMENGAMKLTSAGVPGTESNRIEDATALAAYLQYRLDRGRWTVLPGLRYEHIVMRRTDFGRNDPERVGTNASTNANTVDVFIPGIGVDYAFTPSLSAFAGVHKGFGPPGSREGTLPEESVNYEVGTRYRAGTFRAEGIFFFSDYSNLLGSDLAAGGGSGTTRLFNGGAVSAVGLELTLSHNLGAAANWNFSLPAFLAYTFTDAQFKTSFESEFGPWGTVTKGDRLPYLSRHQLSAGTGVENEVMGLHLNANYVGSMRTEAGQGPIAAGTDARVVLDASAFYAVTSRATVVATVRNLTDEVYVVARRPAGLRPGLPRTLLLGVKARL